MAKDGDDDRLTIIGIGSSAGGLEAIRELAATLPSKLPVSYVVVQHMSPHHKSLMTELVARQTELRVEDIIDDTTPRANVIYITPPKTDLILKDGKLRLVAPSELPSAPKPSVDRFLLSLAEDHGSKAVAMILSGTGSDGAYGVQAIREAGGITIAQEADSAKYDGMPQAAIQTGCVDLVLRPVEIGTHLQKILSSPKDFGAFRKSELNETPLSDILQILLARTRVDFRDYKQTTIQRRIERRMIALGIESQEEYTEFLRNNPAAVDALFKDLLISVTRFFRDRTEFEMLRDNLATIVGQRGEAPIRVWVAGCATGEEAYSIAMLLSELTGGPETPLKQRAQIFATDIDKEALQIARSGVYTGAALADIPEALASKYLVRHGDGIRVTDNLRSAVLFSDHNVCQDPPFQRVDLLCCRNLLIYFGSNLQRKVLARFHYSLARDGLLFLGTAESVAGSDELFIQTKLDHHLYRKRAISKRDMPYSVANMSRFEGAATVAKSARTDGQSVGRQLFEALVGSLGDNSILAAEDCSILRIHGSISPYVEMTERSRLNMHTDLLCSPLKEEVRSLITLALKHGKKRQGLRHVMPPNTDKEVRLTVYPILSPATNERVALVVFEELEPAPKESLSSEIEGDLNEVVAARIRDLEQDISVTREALQQTIEELETSNEELQSLNEELQSTNEELQATNEELETSNEELQSTNEELITVNEELQITATELSGRTGELTSVLQSTPLAILVTDSALQVTQMTDAAAEMFGMRRPLSHPHVSQCNLPDGYPPLAPICSEALRLGMTKTHEFISDQSQVRLSCTPYFDVQGKILGLTLVVTEFPGLAREMEMLQNNSNIHVINRTRDGNIVRISQATADLFGVDKEAAETESIFDILPIDLCAQIREADKRLDLGEVSVVKEVSRVNLDRMDRPKWLAMEHYRFKTDAQWDPIFYTIATDITETIGELDQTAALTERFRQVQDSAGYGYWELQVDKQAIFWSQTVFELHGVDPAEGVPDYEDAVSFYHPEDVPAVEAAVESAMKPGGEFRFEARLQRADGTQIKVESMGHAITNAAGEVTMLIGTFREI